MIDADFLEHRATALLNCSLYTSIVSQINAIMKDYTVCLRMLAELSHAYLMPIMKYVLFPSCLGSPRPTLVAMLFWGLVSSKLPLYLRIQASIVASTLMEA